MASHDHTAPPDLRVLCRKLTSIPPTQLPHSLPSLVRHLLQCRDALSAPQDQKLKADASQTALLVHKLRTSVTTLLNGRSREGRLVAVALVKAAVDVGGWETLRGAEPWIRGLLSIVQKADPAASKELAIVTLTKIYLLLQSYQTLVREMATPTLPAFITACLQLINPKPIQVSSGASPRSPPAAPPTLVETICESFSALIPSYPTTFRPFSSQIRNAIRSHLAPAPSSSLPPSTESPLESPSSFESSPESLQDAARRLVISIHHVAAKSAGSQEWAKLLDDLLAEFHTTADHVLRGVNEAWAAESGRPKPSIPLDGEPRSGDSSCSSSADNLLQLSPWSGLDAGVSRLVGIFDTLASVLTTPTKSAVAIPLGRIMETVARVCLVARLSRSQTWEQSVETNPAIGRDEKDELWSLMPEIHIAATRLLTALLSRLERHALPLTPEIIDHLTRIFVSGIAIPRVRCAGYILLRAVLPLCGPTLSRTSVDLLEPLIAACCRDLQQHANVLDIPDKPSPSASKDPKKNNSGSRNTNTAAINMDLFLKPQTAAATSSSSSSSSFAIWSTSLDAPHAAAATALLPVLFTHLPQPILKPIIRGLLDKTAILTRHKDAMLASVLNPYKDQRGRMYPSILPHLTRQFPHDQALEVLRSILRTAGISSGGGEMFASITEEDIELQDAADESSPENAEGSGNDERDGQEEEEQRKASKSGSGAGSVVTGHAKVELPIQVNPFEANPQRETSPLGKRKHTDGADAAQPTKRQELDQDQPEEPVRVAELPSIIPTMVEGAMDEDSDDDSVHLEMVLEDDDDEDEEDE